MASNAEYKVLMKSRQNLYRFLGNVFQKEVDQASLDCIKAMAFPTDCCEPELDEGYRILRTYLDSCGSSTVTDLAVDYAKIFLGAGISQGSAAFPYESVYTSPKKIVMQDAWETVRATYSAKGLVKGNVGSEILEDHIAMELEYMSFLCGEAHDDPNNLNFLQEQRDFLNAHLLNWVPRFCADVEKYAETPFYKAIGKITSGYLKLDKALLDSTIDSFESKAESALSCSVTSERMDEIIRELKKEYKIYAPKCFAKRGAKNNSDLIRYAEIDSVKEIVLNAQSDFSPKEIFYPVTQTMIYFKDGKSFESTDDNTKGIIIFMRPCDINGLKRLDTIFLKNGGMEDLYYKRLREKVKIFMLECREGYDNCFCVSMGSNQTENYSLAMRFEDSRLLVQVKDEAFEKYFFGETASDFSPEFVTVNLKKAALPKIENRDELKTAMNLDFWKEYDDKCIGCGGCNTACPTCSCFDTTDIIYNETSCDGERRRVWSSCMLDTYTMTAGGRRSRNKPGENMRFKTLHKVYDYNLRFGGNEHMCVGCGRCEKRCPRDISFFNTISRLSEEMEKAKTIAAAEGIK